MFHALIFWKELCEEGVAVFWRHFEGLSAENSIGALTPPTFCSPGIGRRALRPAYAGKAEQLEKLDKL